MAADCIVGIDAGTQSLKAVVVDREMRVLATAAVSYQVSYPKPGWAEQSPLAWEEALLPAIHEALARAKTTASNVLGVGITGQLDGCVAVGFDGHPLGRALIWMDRRASQEAKLASAEIVRKKCGVQRDATHMAAKIAYLKKAVASEGVRCFHQPVSYLVSRLTDRHVFDHGLASTTMLYSLERRGYDPELLNAYGIAREELPEICDAGVKAGGLTQLGARLTGLLEGTPVAVGTGDDFAAPLGAGITGAGKMIGVLGTAEVVGAFDTRCLIDGKGLVETHRLAADSFFIENPGWLGGGSVAWFQKAFRLKDVNEVEALAAQAPSGSDGLIFLPALNGAMAPEWVVEARACFYGLTNSHGLAQMARAVLEGCAFSMRDVLERLREMTVPVESIVLTGGGAKSALWSQIRADVCDLPVYTTELKDTSPLGAAMLAAVAVKQQPNLEACAKLVGQLSARFNPDPATRSVYENAYFRYRKLFESLRPMYDCI